MTREEALEQEPCEDWYDVPSDEMTLGQARRAVKDLRKKLSEQIEQEPKTGRWIGGKCNRCGTHAPYWAMASTFYLSEYCPKCGARMESEE